LKLKSREYLSYSVIPSEAREDPVPAVIVTNSNRSFYHGPYFSTFTPFQNATYPAICFAAVFGSG
jgi:hypothetical protein